MRSPPMAKRLSRLEIRLFGFPEFRRGGGLLPPLATHKAQSLLAYLILNRDQPHSRDKLATLFWGDQDDVHARHSFATALWRIRRLLASDEYLFTDSTSIQFNPASPFWLDTAEFERLAHGSSAIGNLKSAIELYRGDLLEGFYDDWCLEERYRLEALYLATLSRLVIWCEEQNDATSTLEYASKYLARDSLQENIHLAAMRAFAQLGNLTGARRQWQFYCEARQQELHAQPSPKMLQQAKDLLGTHFAIPLHIQSTVAPTRTRHANLEQPPFVGRAPELNALIARWEQASQGRGGVVWIEGEAGIGKTRLCEEFATTVRWHGGAIARAHCYEPTRIVAYQPIADIVRGLLALNKPRDVLALPPWALDEIARLLPELGGEHPVPLSPPTTAPLLHALATLVRRFALHTPILIILEDLHWATDSTIAALDYLAHQIGDARVLIVGTIRPEEISERHPLMTMQVQLAREGLAQQLPLVPLSADAVDELVRRLRMNVEADCARQLYLHTEGNPLFLIETLRELDAFPRRGTILPVPNTVRALIRARLERLSAPAREFVAYAAVAGRGFDFEPVLRASGAEEETALVAIDELLRTRFLREGAGGGAHDYEFEHSLIHQIVYASLHHRRQQRLHRLLGEAIERLYGEQRPDLFGVLAHHFDRAEIGDKALYYSERAAQHAWRLCAASEVEQHYDTALHWLERLGTATLGERAFRERRFDLLLGREQALDVLARRAEQATAQQLLIELADALDDKARRTQARLRRFWFHYPSQLDEARRLAESALALARQQDNRALVVQSPYALALAWARLGDPACGLEYAQSALDEARALGDRVLEGWSLLQLGFILKQWNDGEQAQMILEQSLEINRALGNQFAVGRTLIHLGDVCHARGRVEEAERYYHDALALAQEIGYRWVEEDARARLKLFSL